MPAFIRTSSTKWCYRNLGFYCKNMDTLSLNDSLVTDIMKTPLKNQTHFKKVNFDPADTAKVQREMCSALKARKDALEEILRKKTEELKNLCIKEGELTGHLPAETPLAPGEQPPQIRRRVGTAFSLDTTCVKGDNENEDMSKKLELEVELQKQITNAAHKLASDKSVSRFVRKQRRHSFIKAQSKLKEMEKKLSEYRKGDIPASPAMSGKFDDSDVVSPAQSPLVPRGPRSNYKQHDDRPGHPNSPLHRSNTAPKDFLKEREIVSMTLPPTHSSPTLDDMYKPNTVYATQYRNQTYPTLAGRDSKSSNHSSGGQGYQDGSSQGHLDGYEGKMSHHGGLDHGRLEGSRDSGFSSTNNMYNVGSRRTSRYESNQDLVTPGGDSHTSDTLDNVFDSRLKLHSKLGSTDSSASQMQKSYGSLERNMKKRQNRDYQRKLSDTDTSVDTNSTAPNRFGKRTSKSEFDLSSKGRDYPVSSKETDYPLVNHLKDYLANSSSQNTRRIDKITIDRQDSAAGHRMIEVPVKHETMSTNHRPDRNLDFSSHSGGWRDSASTEPSPIIQSPTKQNSTETYASSTSNISTIDDSKGQCYSPRSYEGSRAATHSKPPHPEHKVRVNYIDSTHGTPQATSSKIVTVKMSPHVEVSKPFEMKDFYKYSEKLRRQRLVEQYHQALVGSRSTSPSQSQHSGDGDSRHSSTYHHSYAGTPSTPSHSTSGSQYGQSTPTSIHPAYRGTSTSSNSPFGSPVSSRHMTSSHPYPSSSSSLYHDNTNYGNSRNNIETSSSTTTTSTYGVSTTTSRVQYTVQSQGGRVLYKAQHQSSKHTHYQPPTSMKCEPVRSTRDLHSGSHEAPATPTGSRTQPAAIHHQRQYSTPERSCVSPMNMSNFHLSPAGTLSQAFSSEMLEWFDGEGNQAPTSV